MTSKGGGIRPLGGLRVTTEEADRLLAACRLVGDHPDEQRLLKAEIDSITLYRSGTSAVYEVRYMDGSRAAFKPIEGVEASAAGYGHTALSVILNDYAAWLVARGLGYGTLVRGVAIATIPEPGVGLGSMQTWLDGQPSGTGWEGATELAPAGLFDAVIGQQDRNGTNFNYDQMSDELGLFDQSFTFALPAHQQGASQILAKLHDQGAARLGQPLIDALDRFEASPERVAIQQILAPDRWARMETRIALMKQRGELLQGGEY
jgi:hypothetical protein